MLKILHSGLTWLPNPGNVSQLYDKHENFEIKRIYVKYDTIIDILKNYK